MPRATGSAGSIGDDAANSVYAYERRAPGAPSVVVVVNMTPVPREHYRIGVPAGGVWREAVNTDAGTYGGSNLGNAGRVTAAPVGSHGHDQSVELVLPPLGALVLVHES